MAKRYIHREPRIELWAVLLSWLVGGWFTWQGLPEADSLIRLPAQGLDAPPVRLLVTFLGSFWAIIPILTTLLYCDQRRRLAKGETLVTESEEPFERNPRDRKFLLIALVLSVLSSSLQVGLLFHHSQSMRLWYYEKRLEWALSDTSREQYYDLWSKEAKTQLEWAEREADDNPRLLLAFVELTQDNIQATLKNLQIVNPELTSFMDAKQDINSETGITNLDQETQ